MVLKLIIFCGIVLMQYMYVCSRIARSIAGVYNRGAIFGCIHQGRICYIICMPVCISADLPYYVHVTLVM